MFFRVNVAIISDSKCTEPFACTLAFRIALTRKHYDRSPHCRTVSLTVGYPPFFDERRLYCGVDAIHLDTHIITHHARSCKGYFLQFSPFLFVNSAVRKVYTAHRTPSVYCRNKQPWHFPDPAHPEQLRFHSRSALPTEEGRYPPWEQTPEKGRYYPE